MAACCEGAWTRVVRRVVSLFVSRFRALSVDQFVQMPPTGKAEVKNRLVAKAISSPKQPDDLQ